MIKFVLQAKRKAGMSRQDFMNYCDSNLFRSRKIMAMAKNVKKRRNFMIHDQVLVPDNFSGEINYGVITETIFPQDILIQLISEAADPEKASLLTEDE